MQTSSTDLARMIDLARGQTRVELLIKNANLVNTLSGEVSHTNLAVSQGLILGWGEYSAEQVYDAKGAYLCPGFIEAHIHIESTMLTPGEFARNVSGRGTAVAVCDAHEIANVLGVQGLEYFVRCTQNLPGQIYFLLPSCVPATHMETSGTELKAEELNQLLQRYAHRFLGLGEMMNFPGVLYKDPQVLNKLVMSQGMIIDGHAPGLTGQDLNAYILAGPGSDHECTTLEEAREKLAKGMHIMVREGTTARNMQELLPLVTEHNWPGFSLVCDDRHPEDLYRLGHLDYNLRRAVALGLDPVRAVQMVSINPARYFGLQRQGALSPGFFADMVLVEDLQDFNVQEVFLRGRPWRDLSFESGARAPGNSMHVAPLELTSLQVSAQQSRLRAIGIVPGQIVTREVHIEPRVENGLALPDPDRELAKLAVVERHKSSGNVGLGFIKGLPIQKGALASTVGHDAHNLILAGICDEDMLAAARTVIDMQGGLAAVLDGKVLAALPLPVAGLMSKLSLEQTSLAMQDLHQACQELGLQGGHPFMTLSFLSLPVIPDLKLTDQGLVDVNRFEFVDLWV